MVSNTLRCLTALLALWSAGAHADITSLADFPCQEWQKRRASGERVDAPQMWLSGFMTGLAIGVAKRGEGGVARPGSRMSLGIVIVQLMLAAALVEMHLPLALRSMHQAIGTMVWAVTFTFAVLARRAAHASDTGGVNPVGETRTVGGSFPVGGPPQAAHGAAS